MKAIKYDVFISRKTEDAHLAEQVYQFLTTEGLKVFEAHNSLPKQGNADYGSAIAEALTGTTHLIILGSSVENIKAPWVQHEWRAFLNSKLAGYKTGNLLTIATRRVKRRELPLDLTNYQIIPFENYKEELLSYLLNKDDEGGIPKTEKPEIKRKIPVKVWYLSFALIALALTVILIKFNPDSETADHLLTAKSASPKDTSGIVLPDKDIESLDTSKIMSDKTIAKGSHPAKIHPSNKKVNKAIDKTPNYDTLSIAELEPMAANGVAEVQFMLGEKNFNAGNYQEALKWFQQAAEKGNEIAQWRLGIMYEYGSESDSRFPVKQDYTTALKWYLKSAQQGNANSQYSVGYYYLNHTAGSENKAKDWFIKSARQGNPAAKDVLAKVYKITNY